MSKLIINNHILNDVPINEYYLEKGNKKGLVFIQHGFQSNKSRGADYLAINVARLGYFVIAVDAYKHGDRIEEPYITGADYLRYADAYNVVDKTSNDIIKLYEDYYKSDYNGFDIIGVSMGGFIAYSVAIKCNYVKKLLPVITTPNFMKLATTRTNVPGLEEYLSELENHLEMIKSIDPITRIDELKYESMFMLNGTLDSVIDYHPTVEFYEQYKNDNISLKLYEEGHAVNRKMQVDILEYISNEKVVL